MKLNLSNYTLAEFFEAAVTKYANRPALAFVGETPFTYAEFGQRVAMIRQQLHELGLKKQDKVAILGPNSPNWAIAYMAITTYGAVAVPVMDEFPEADVEHTINHSEAKAVFIDEGFYTSMNIASLETINVIFKLNDLSLLKGTPLNDNLWEQIHNLPEKIKKSTGSLPELPPAEAEWRIDEDDLAQILYTSGTTGHSKGVMLTHKNLVSNAIGGPEVIGNLTEETVLLGILPLAHAFGSTCAFLSIVYGGASIYYLNRKPSPKILMAAMQSVKPTFLGAVPLIFEKIYQKQVVPAISGNKVLNVLVKVPPFRKIIYRLVGRKVKQALGGRLECAVIGGAGLAADVERFMREGGIPYIVGYGMSECAPLVTGSAPEDTKFGSSGYPITDVQVKIVDPDPESGIGEILVKGPNVMKGYFKNEAETKKVFTDDGWLITGDRGYLDDDNYLFIKGRSKNVIIGSSGENIYPEVVEDKLKSSPYVDEALVYELDGQVVARVYPDYSYIESHSRRRQQQDEGEMAQTITDILEAVRRQTNQNLPSFSRIQKMIEQQSPFLKTPTNKIRRGEYIPNYGQQ